MDGKVGSECGCDDSSESETVLTETSCEIDHLTSLETIPYHSVLHFIALYSIDLKKIAHISGVGLIAFAALRSRVH